MDDIDFDNCNAEEITDPCDGEFNFSWYMGEPEAVAAIKQGWVKIGDTIFTVVPRPDGSCATCYFEEDEHCPQMALNICCTGGNVLRLKRD